MGTLAEPQSGRGTGTVAQPDLSHAHDDVWTYPERERIGTSATVVTFVRTIASVVLAGIAAHERDIDLLVVALGVYWVGDMLDGFVARVRGCETRIGAVLDILCDRLCAACFYVGLVWLKPHLAPAVLLYLANFTVLDCFLSLAFLAWAVRSPNYFSVVDKPLYTWNWSKPAKAANSAIFAVVLLVTDWMWLGLAAAAVLCVLKVASLVRLARIGLPVPPQPVPPVG